MKKSLFTLVALCLICSTPLLAQQDQEIPVLLSEENPHYSKEWVNQDNNPSLRISVEKGEADANGDTQVTLEIENLDQQWVFWLFGKANDEKELKKNYAPRGIQYDGSFGPHGKTEIYQIPNEKYANDYRIDNLSRSHSFNFTAKEDETIICKLPIYYAQDKNGFLCRRTILYSKMVITLNITVENKIDEEYDRLSQQCDSLIQCINNATFCRHKLHHPKLEKQKEPYLQTRNDLIERIEAMLENSNWAEGSRNYKLYHALDDKLDDIEDMMEDREVDDCGDAKKHVAPHSCSYCQWTLKQIYSKLDRYNKQLDLGDVSKDNVIKDVKILYKCYQYGPKNASNKRKEQQQYKTKIEDLYKKINSY